MTANITEAPGSPSKTFLDFPLELNLNSLNADIAILGVPYGLPYSKSRKINDQSRAPDAIRRISKQSHYIRERYDWDLDASLLDGRDIKVVDCGNVTTDPDDPIEHYRRAETAAKKIFGTGATLITLGGDHGIPIPIMRALEVFGNNITLIHIDAHLDWRNNSKGVTEGFRSPIRRASEMAWIGKIVQIGIRGNGSLDRCEIEEALARADIITAYQMHDMGVQAVLDRIPDGGPYYLTIDADGLDPTIMPGVVSQTPGGLNWMQTRKLIHGLTNKGRVLGMDLVEISPEKDVSDLTLVHAERLLCNFIGACVQTGYYDN